MMIRSDPTIRLSPLENAVGNRPLTLRYTPTTDIDKEAHCLNEE